MPVAFTPVRDDRHGRLARADSDRRRRPSDGFRVRDVARFQRIAEDAIATLPSPVLDALAEADLVLEEIPPEPAAGENVVPLAEFRPAGVERARVTVYRRPIEARAITRGEVADLVRLAVGREVAFTLGLDVDLDDDWD